MVEHLGTHSYLKVPVIKLGDLDQLSIEANGPETVYHLDIGDGMEIAFLLNPRQAINGLLRIGFHAAKGARAGRGHLFTPVNQSRASKDPFLLFSDPTLTLRPTVRLSWYLGTPDVDPDDWMEKITRHVMHVVGAQYLLVEGSSGGGFVSMRFATRFRNAVAVPKIPQTDLFRYTPGALRSTLSFAWPGWSRERILEEHPGRFRVIDLYSDSQWNRGNLVRYVQNPGDRSHVSFHLRPFLRELGGTPESSELLDDRVIISKPYVGKGHVAFSAEQWVIENNYAIADLRKTRPEPVREMEFAKPNGFSRSVQVDALRDANLAHHYSI